MHPTSKAIACSTDDAFATMQKVQPTMAHEIPDEYKCAVIRSPFSSRSICVPPEKDIRASASTLVNMMTNE